MTMPSSTSQSVLVEPRGSSMSSFGPLTALVHFAKTTGSCGSARPDSAA
jgi:hypothetical protein